MTRIELEESYRQLVRTVLICLLVGFGFFLAGGIAYAAGASVLLAWAGLIAFGAISSSAAILLALTVREDGRLIGKLHAENKARRAAEARRIEVELRLADVYGLLRETLGKADDAWIELIEGRLGAGFFSQMDHALRGDPGHGEPSEMAMRRRRAHLEHRDYLEFPELPTLDGPRADEL